ncbi:hypothetical protein BO71DRAFT_460449 [Aspergillus ellipticus CBS 707.79]|uniref:Uncharacterized protein n=1 Tax=Aspergillus ellipticus CBS 707.79 TaxID=1448320 RepID=A0A319D1Z7_9EURO|nr:hypothetical protein BO71DRAFT_460449 [Aspergillus ellipticus CBS 707.79]
MEDHPMHWKATLLGEDFWRDAFAFNQPIHDRIKAGQNNPQPQDTPLHKKFPFNLVEPSHAPFIRVTESEPASPTSQRSRRCSMTDASAAPSTATTHMLDISRRTRSESRARSQTLTRSSSTALRSSRSSSRIRSVINKLTSSRKKEEPEPMSTIKLIPAREATPSKPLMDFRGGETWARLANDRYELGIDVFWPDELDAEWEVDEETAADSKNQQQPELRMLDIEQLSPLCQFRNLRSLKITGMMRSYQKYIWQAAWLNPNLEELELGMVVEPRITLNIGNLTWPFIKHGWQRRHYAYAPSFYHGDGTGTLKPRFGQGEYLDKIVIEAAKVRAMAMGATLHWLSIQKLTLSGFVVDADPFLQWFDHNRLQTLYFKNYCVDSGLWFPPQMRDVLVQIPQSFKKVDAIAARRVSLRSELKVVDV